MKRTLPFALATLGILALFAASPILPKLGVPLDVEKVVNAVFQDDAVEEVVLGDVAFFGPSATCFTGTLYNGYPNGAPNVLDTVYTRGEVGQLLPDTACDGSNKITGRWYLVTGTTLPVAGNPYPIAQLRSVYRVDTDTAGGVGANASDSLYSYVFMPTSPGTAYPIYVHTVRIKPSATQTAPAMPAAWPGGAATYNADAANTNGMGADQADASETGSTLTVDALSGDGWLELPRLSRYGAWYIETSNASPATFDDSTATDTLVQYFDRVGRRTKPNRWTLPDSTNQNLLQKVNLTGQSGFVLYYVNESHFNANSNQGYIRKLTVTVTTGQPLSIANHTNLNYALEDELGNDSTFVYCANTSFTLPATAAGSPAISGRWYRDLTGNGLTNDDSLNATGVDGANLNTICRPVGIDTFFFVPTTTGTMRTKRVIGIAIPPQPVFSRSWASKPDQVGTFWTQDSGCGEVSGAAWSVGGSNTTAATRVNTTAPALTTKYDLCEGTAFPLADSSDIHFDPTDPSNDVLNYAYPDTTFVGRWFHNSVPMPAVATGANTVTTADYYYRASRFVVDVRLGANLTEVNVDSVRFRDNSYTQSCWNTLQVSFRIHPNHPEFANMQQTYCEGETPAALPTTSSNGVAGTWSPATINTSTVGATTYTFTPDASQHPSCVSQHSVTIVVTRKSTPVFNDTTICVGSTLSLSTTSRDGIAGSWNTSNVNTSVVGSYTATFTPTVSGANAGNCYGNATITVRVAAAVAVSCPSSINITLDPESCTKTLTFDALQMNGCADATHKIIVQDNNPLNGAVIDCPGTWTYGIFTKADNQLICWGTVNAEDKSGPLLIGFYQGATLNGAGGACRSYVAYTGAWHSAPWTTPPTSTVGNASQRFGVIDGDGATAGQQPVSQWTSELMCTDVNRVLNVAASWDGRTANYAYYTGRPDFADGCNKISGGPDFGSPTVDNLTNGSCACTDTLKANDQIVYYPCSATGANNDILEGYWATITRTFTSTDCRGNVSTVSQTINFRRPAIADFAGGAVDPEQDGIFEGDTRQMPGMIVLDSTACNSFDKAEMIRRLKAGQYYNTAALQEDRLIDDRQPKYIFDDLYSCDANERYSYFAEAVTTGNYNNLMTFTGNNWGPTAATAGVVTKRLECNYSFDIEEVTQFPVCNGGMKLQVEVTAFDWCTGKRNVMDNILLKWTDAVKPSIVPSAAADRANNTTNAPGADNVHDKPVIISTGALDCTASFGIDIVSLESFFGIDVSDNCTPDNLIDLNVQVQSCVYPTTHGIVTGSQQFQTVQYRTMVANGRNMVMGVPVGQHRLTITAFDKCYNQWTRSFDFTVLDRTAPVMKCTDQLTVTIANSSTSGPTNQFGGYGQTHPLTGYAVKGYAKVNVSEINRGSSDNCGMDWVRVRREIDPADASDVAFFVAAGYDSNGDGTISTADGVDWNSDGDINDLMEKFETNNMGQMMTPALDFVEFHCGDLVDAGGVMIELWGRDKETNILTCNGNGLPTTPVTSGGNTNFCWMNVVVEDKVAPTFTRPSDARITCYNREALDTLRKAASVSGGLDITSSTYKWIETNIFVPQGDGRFIVNSGDDCNALTVKATVNVTGINNCDSSGSVTITYSATKPNVQSGNATSTTVIVPVVNQRGVSQSVATILVRRVHEYNLRFPADVSVLCTSGQITTRDTANVADGGELGCDILSVNVTDKRYNGAVNASGTPVADCYRIYRTYTVVNWCQYDDRCGEPMQWAVIVPRDPANNNGNYNSTTATNPTGSTVANSGVNVLVRDLNANASESTTAATRIYFEDASKNLTPETNELVSSFTYNNSQNAPCASVDASKAQFAWMYTQYLYVTDRTAPEATINAATGTSIRKDNCVAPVSITFTATDACAGATGTESQNATTANPSIAIERVRLRTYTASYQGSAAPSPVNSFQANEQASTIADVAGAQVSPSQALNLGTKNGGAWTYSANLARGWYGLIVVVRDDCGNLSTQKELTFRVVDDQPTSPICYNGLSTDLMTTPMGGRMEVWASDFIAERKVYDCTGTGVAEPSNANLKQLEKYWVVKDDNGDGNFNAADGLVAATNAQGLAIFVPTGAANNSVTFDCDDLGDVAVRLYTRDEAGNWAWCETFAKITDARGVCPSGPGTQSAAVAGAIATESNLNVEGVEVSLSGDATMSYATNVNGQYNFAGLKKGYDYTVTPQLDKNYLNGVSTFDLVLITKHILGVQPLNSPYRLIAADVNNSRSVTTLDLIQLRKLILNIDTKFANNTSWRFVDSSFKFSNPANPWAAQFPEVANLNDVAADVRANFVAVKIGDVNGNAVASSQVRTNGTFGLNVSEQALKAGNEYTVVFSGDLSQVEGYQFTLALDGNAVELVNLEAGIAKEENFGIFAKEGVVTASWNGEAGNGNLFSLVVRAKADANLSEVLNLNSRYTAAEAYNKAGEQLNVALNFTGAQPVAAGFDLKQNTPNPFAGETVVGFNLPVAGDATLTVQDVTGRTLRVIKGAYAQGYNQVILKSNDLKATGVLYYTLESGEFTATRKMVILE